MPERYRTEYDGEFVITVNTIKNGEKHQEREWIDNPIENQHISGRAAVLVTGKVDTTPPATAKKLSLIHI